jgi:hypothetical protein
LEEVECQTLRRLRPNARKLLKLLNDPLDLAREKAHDKKYG